MQISIHALREEGDVYTQTGGSADIDFYPRPPRGGRRTGLDQWEIIDVISIHALREEGDYLIWRKDCKEIDFYPRPPRGGRPR